ncbi:unnamed protein product, partial [Timema podura]|nr:unnamed protein product [Timema podura]
MVIAHGYRSGFDPQRFQSFCKAPGLELRQLKNQRSDDMDLYYRPGSPPCRAVVLLIKTLGLDVNYILKTHAMSEPDKKEFLK